MSDRRAKTTELAVNHEEAFLLAWNKRDESNIARCYLEMRAWLAKIRDGHPEDAARFARRALTGDRNG